MVGALLDNLGRLSLFCCCFGASQDRRSVSGGLSKAQCIFGRPFSLMLGMPHTKDHVGNLLPQRAQTYHPYKYLRGLRVLDFQDKS